MNNEETLNKVAKQLREVHKKYNLNERDLSRPYVSIVNDKIEVTIITIGSVILENYQKICDENKFMYCIMRDTGTPNSDKILIILYSFEC
jgi:hypothetical protein